MRQTCAKHASNTHAAHKHSIFFDTNTNFADLKIILFYTNTDLAHQVGILFCANGDLVGWIGIGICENDGWVCRGDVIRKLSRKVAWYFLQHLRALIKIARRFAIPTAQCFDYNNDKGKYVV